MTFYKDILKDAAKHASIEFDRLVTVEQIRDKTKVRSVVAPRHYCVAYMHAIGRFSLPQVAIAFNRNDHTTILNSLRKAHGHDGRGFQVRNGVREPIEPLWNKELFVNLVRRDGYLEQPITKVSEETILAVGEQNLKRFANGRGWI